MIEENKELNNRWICSQLGAREKYSIPRALMSQNSLSEMITDLWIEPNTFLSKLLKRSKGRFHYSLNSARIKSFNELILLKRITYRIKQTEFDYDSYYDKLVSSYLAKNKPVGDMFFSYSYTARDSFRIAKQMGLRTILGQINPGPAEAAIVEDEYRSYHGGIYKPFVPTQAYWDRWTEEVAVSDTIIVNSEWSKQLLIKSGVAEEKCVVIPLAYEGSSREFVRSYPSQFSKTRPLRILFLGGLELRKGFHILILAMKAMQHLPIKLDVVGELKGPEDLLKSMPSNIHYHGSVALDEVDVFYKESDVFMFPTLSDGFGLTQLEAQSYKLPLIVSPFCAPIVSHFKNGYMLNVVTSESIKQAIECILDQPELLQKWSDQSITPDTFSLARLVKNLNTIVS